MIIIEQIKQDFKKCFDIFAASKSLKLDFFKIKIRYQKDDKDVSKIVFVLSVTTSLY